MKAECSSWRENAAMRDVAVVPKFVPTVIGNALSIKDLKNSVRVLQTHHNLPNVMTLLLTRGTNADVMIELDGTKIVMAVPRKRKRYLVSQGTYGKSLLRSVVDEFFTAIAIRSFVIFDIEK